MKGPGLRIDLDVRRIWRCAKCGKTARTAGHVTAQRCGCSDEFPWMRLELPPKREPFQPPHREPLPEYDDAPESASVPPETPTVETPATVLPPEITESPTAAAEPVPPETPAVAVPEAPPPPDEFGAGLAQSQQ